MKISYNQKRRITKVLKGINNKLIYFVEEVLLYPFNRYDKEQKRQNNKGSDIYNYIEVQEWLLKI